MELKMKHLALSSLLVAGLLSGCSADNGAEDDITSKDVIRMTVKNDWQTLTRATSIYEDDNQLTPFKVYAYKHGTDAKFIDGSRVIKSGQIWEPDHKYYWPVLDALDFFVRKGNLGRYCEGLSVIYYNERRDVLVLTIYYF